MAEPQISDPIFSARVSFSDPKPADFAPADWRILKQAGSMVAAIHTETGECKKLPASWFKD